MYEAHKTRVIVISLAIQRRRRCYAHTAEREEDGLNAQLQRVSCLEGDSQREFIAGSGSGFNITIHGVRKNEQ